MDCSIKAIKNSEEFFFDIKDQSEYQATKVRDIWKLISEEVENKENNFHYFTNLFKRNYISFSLNKAARLMLAFESLGKEGIIVDQFLLCVRQTAKKFNKRFPKFYKDVYNLKQIKIVDQKALQFASNIFRFEIEILTKKGYFSYSSINELDFRNFEVSWNKKVNMANMKWKEWNIYGLPICKPIFSSLIEMKKDESPL